MASPSESFEVRCSRIEYTSPSPPLKGDFTFPFTLISFITIHHKFLKSNFIWFKEAFGELDAAMLQLAPRKLNLPSIGSFLHLHSFYWFIFSSAQSLLVHFYTSLSNKALMLLQLIFDRQTISFTSSYNNTFHLILKCRCQKP